MSYRFDFPEDVPSGIKRIAREQVDRSIRNLEDPGDDLHEAIHDSRKRWKKTRAVLRLVRPHIGSDVYDRENVAYRDAGRLLSPLREAHVAPETVALLATTFESIVREGAFSGVVEALEERECRVAEELGRRCALEEALSMARAARGRIEDWPIEPIGFDALGDGLKKVYKRGRKRMADAYDDPSGPAFHEWRKRVKYLWYHTRILRPTWDDVLDEVADQIHDLSDLLGEGNDLTDLLILMEEEPEHFGDAETRDALRALATDRRQTLWTEAKPLGERIYTESPSDFVTRYEAYWKAADRELADNRGSELP